MPASKSAADTAKPPSPAEPPSSRRTVRDVYPELASQPDLAHLADVEVTQALRRLIRGGEVSPDHAAEAIADLADLDLHRHPHLDLLSRAWKLRENVTAYDAMYVALAEALDAPIVTCNAPLARAPGHRARIEVIE